MLELVRSNPVYKRALSLVSGSQRELVERRTEEFANALWSGVIAPIARAKGNGGGDQT